MRVRKKVEDPIPAQRRRRVRKSVEEVPDAAAKEKEEQLARRNEEIAKYRFVHVYAKGSNEEPSFRAFMQSNNLKCDRAETPAGNFYYRMPADVIESFEHFSSFQFCPSNGWFGSIPSISTGKKKGFVFFVRVSKGLALDFMWDRLKWEVVCDGKTATVQKSPIRRRRRVRAAG